MQRIKLLHNSSRYPFGQYAALDQSTTSTRFTLMNKKSEFTGFHQVLHKQITHQQGWLEHDPIEILNNSILCMEEVYNKNGSKIESIGISNQRETVVAWNKETGQPYMNAIVWSDTRTTQICKQYLSKYNKNHFQQKTGLPINTYFTAYKIKWMLENCQEIRNNIQNVLFGTIDTWLIWNLTIQRNHVTDVTNASRTNLMNLRTLQWDEEILKEFSIPLHTLPTIQPSSSFFGTIGKGSYKGVPITGVLGDQQAASIGHALFKQGQCKNTQGSGLFMMTNIGNEVRISDKGLLTTVLYQLEGQKPIYGLEGAVETGGQLFNWAKDKMKWLDKWEELSQSMHNTQDNGGVYLVPGFSGLFTPYWNEQVRGTIFGLTYFTSRDHIRRALLEALCYRVREVIEAMEQSGIRVESISVDGGLSQNLELMQLQADITQKKLVQPKVLESTVLGIGLFSGVLGGKVRLDEVRPEMNRIFEGQRNYDLQFQQWKNAVECALNFRQ